jgi:hypothetical protein
MLSGCKPWKKWKIVHDDYYFQLRVDPAGFQWIYLKKKQDAEEPDDFETTAGPFDGLPPVDIEKFNWTFEELELFFGNRDSFQYNQTVVLANQREEAGENKCDIRVFNNGGVLLATYTLNGTCGNVRLNKRERQKLIFAENETGGGWILIDYLTGKKIGESTLPIPAGIQQNEIAELEILNNKYLIVEQRPNLTRISVYSLAGVFLAEFLIPGEFKEAIHNGTYKKLFVTESVNGTFGDIIDLNTRTVQNIGGTINARNPMPGESADLQYHKINNNDRWVHAAYNPGNGQITIRIIDENSVVLRTHVYTGQLNTKSLMGRQDERKVWALNRANNTDVAVIDLATGDLVRYQTIAGIFRTMVQNSDQTQAIVTTDNAGSPVTQPVGLY